MGISTLVVKNSDVNAAYWRRDRGRGDHDLTSKNADDAEVHAGEITVSVPCYRTDIMHPVDIIEDIAIGFGYENLPPSFPKAWNYRQQAGRRAAVNRR